jgi:large subunit ribosomal protein L35e
MVKVKAYELRTKNEGDLLKQLDELKAELAQLRVAKVSGGAAAKLGKIKQVRKAIARVLTVHTEQRRTASKAVYAGKNLKPVDQRRKLTRALRRALTPGQKTAVTKRVQTRLNNFPNRRYAVMA